MSEREIKIETNDISPEIGYCKIVVKYLWIWAITLSYCKIVVKYLWIWAITLSILIPFLFLLMFLSFLGLEILSWTHAYMTSFLTGAVESAGWECNSPCDFFISLFSLLFPLFLMAAGALCLLSAFVVVISRVILVSRGRYFSDKA